jgi:hypothetical protein
MSAIAEASIRAHYGKTLEKPISGPCTLVRPGFPKCFRHAFASHSEGEIRYDQDQLRARIRDDGKDRPKDS